MNHVSRITYQRGFTLIEIVVVIALVAFASFVLVDLYFGQNQIYKTQTAELNITNDARAALDEVDLFARQATSVLSTHNTYTTGPQTLILEVQSVNSSSQLITASFDKVIFYYSSNALYRVIEPASGSARAAQTKKLASNLTGLVFGFNNVDVILATEITTDMTIQETVSPYSRSITVSSKSKLRNSN